MSRARGKQANRKPQTSSMKMQRSLSNIDNGSF